MSRFSSYLSNIPLLAAIISLLWVLDGVMRRGIGTDIAPLTMVFYEYLVGFIFVLPLTAQNLINEKPTLKELGLIGFLSVITGPIAVTLFIIALLHGENTSFTTVFMLQKLQPIFAISLLCLMMNRPLHKQFFGYVLLAFVGAFLIITNNSLITWDWQWSYFSGGLAALGAAAVWGISGLFSFAALKENTHQFVTASRFLGGALFALLGLAFFGTTPLKQALVLPHMAQDGVLLLLLGLSAAFISIFVYFKALKSISGPATTFLELLFPLFAIIIDLTIYHQAPSVIQLVGIVTLLIATVKINRLHDFTDLQES
jgi:drug/metabolite transporter (DMT)-like permease